MEKICELLERDLSKTIEEVIKVHQLDEQTVYEEITEYVVTDNILSHYRTILDAIAKGPQTHIHDENVGVWVSGFFGSGKSSFAKNLGYVLADYRVCGHRASDLFTDVVKDPRIAEYVDFIRKSIPCEVVMFDISVDKAAKKSSADGVTEIVYRKMLSHLGYAEDFDIAELEIELEEEGKLEAFLEAFKQLYPDIEWSKARSGAQKIARASAVMHELDPKTYPDASTWSRSVRSPPISVQFVINRLFDLCSRRRPGKALVLIIDEVGQYVARNSERIEDLRAFVEVFGKEGKNRLKNQQIVAPPWIVVTSQEKLDEIVAALDNRSIQLAKLQDRFHYKIDLSPSDIREVATKRVLAKKPEAIPLLSQLYQENAGRLPAQCELERSTLRYDVDEESFIQFYPYLPHFIDLSIAIASGIRLQPGATRHLGGSNRTIIKQAYEMLVSERTHLKDAPIGTVVSLDLVYDLVEGNLSSEKQGSIADISRVAMSRDGGGEIAVRVAKVIGLLEFARDVPRTEKNIAAVLTTTIGQAPPIDEVREACVWLTHHRFIRSTDEGYKLLTSGEKVWADERQKYIQPPSGEQSKIIRTALQDVVSVPALKKHRYRDQKTFQVGYAIGGDATNDRADILMRIDVVRSQDEFTRRLSELQEESRGRGHENDLSWILSLTPEAEDIIAEYYASGRMIADYDSHAAQGRLTATQRECLEAEKRDQRIYWGNLIERLRESLLAGTGVFRGQIREGGELNSSATATLGAFLSWAIPDLFPKMGMGAVPLRGDEAEILLNAENLLHLPRPVFYDGEQGLNIVRREGTQAVLNEASPPVAEVAGFIHSAKEYGNRVTGKTLEENFTGYGYGWDLDLLRLLTAVLFRAGHIEVTYQGQTHQSYLEPIAREVFSKPTSFRAASFTERTGKPGYADLASASDLYVEMTGEAEPDLDEAKIAAAFRSLADRDYQDLVSLRATAQAHQLPLVEQLTDYLAVIEQIKRSDPASLIHHIVAEGRTVKDLREGFLAARRGVTDDLITTLDQARFILNRVVPTLCEEGLDTEGMPERLQEILQSGTFFLEQEDLIELTDTLLQQYRGIYESVHDERTRTYGRAIQTVQEEEDFDSLSPGEKDAVLAELTRHTCNKYIFKEMGCSSCRASIPQMRSDIAAVGELIRTSILQLRELVAKKDPENRPVVKVKLSRFFPPQLEDDEGIEAAIEKLRDELQKLISEGRIVILE